jgi:hypothetical protein
MAAVYNNVSVTTTSQTLLGAVSNGTYNITVSNNTSVVVTVVIYDPYVGFGRWYFAAILSPGETAERKGIVMTTTINLAAESSYASSGNTVDILINGLTA